MASLSMLNDDQDFLLIQCIIRQDRAALGTLYDRYAQIVYAVAYRSLGSIEESEEVVMDVFAKVWSHAATYNSRKARVDGWIFMMTHSRVIDRLRAKQRQLNLKAAIAIFDPTIATDANLDLEVADRRSQVQQALASLPAEQREALELAYYSGWSQREIAERLGVALGTIKTRIRLGLAKLRAFPHLLD
jgi:RNA polymerase sigma-70 factor, ECF subfamily